MNKWCIQHDCKSSQPNQQVGYNGLWYPLACKAHISGFQELEPESAHANIGL